MVVMVVVEAARVGAVPAAAAGDEREVKFKLLL